MFWKKEIDATRTEAPEQPDRNRSRRRQKPNLRTYTFKFQFGMKSGNTITWTSGAFSDGRCRQGNQRLRISRC